MRTTHIKCSIVSACAIAVFSAVLSAPAMAADKIGDACDHAGGINTVASVIPTEGIIQCIPDTNGNYYWQPMGAGVARYDVTATCNVAGGMRWNGTAIQYCDGANWQSMGGGGGTTLVVGGCSKTWAACPAGYTATSYFSPGAYGCCLKCSNPAWRYTVCSQ